MHITLALLVVLLATACIAPVPGVCSAAYAPLAHPTMTEEELVIGLDGHVRAVSEGSSPSQHRAK